MREKLIPEDVVEYAVRALKDLVAIPTVNPPGRDYEKCAGYLADELEKLGFRVELIRIPNDYLDRHYPYAPQHRGHPRYIVYARLGDGRPVLHFNGHYDVVPPGTGWSRDPFNPTVEDGRIYGRGTTDMKGGIAATIAALKHVVDEGLELKGSLEAAFVPDEESGGVGTRYLVEKGYAKPDYVVIGEPTTTGRVVIGHKGLVRGQVVVYGRQVHGSIPWLGENAFLKASALALKFMEAYEPLLKSRKTRAPTILEEGRHPTINLGGYAESSSKKDNTVPGMFVFSFDRRVIPEEDVEEVVEELKEHFEEAAAKVNARCEVKVLSAVQASLTPADSYIVRVAREAISKLLLREPETVITMGRNDAVYYVNISKSQVINLGPGVEKTAHTPDEYTEIGELERAVSIYVEIIRRVLS